MNEISLWIGFLTFVAIILAVDLFVFHKNPHEIRFKEALLSSAIWILLALLFNVVIYFSMGTQRALEFLTGYVIEESLSIDNLFVFIMLFSYFSVPRHYQHKILFWGIIGAVVMRGVFVIAGVALIQKFEWIIYLFGAFLVFTGIKMAFEKGEKMEPDKNPVIRLARKLLPISPQQEEGKFFVKSMDRWMVTPLFVVLLAVETTDIVFAVDSIPAVLAVSRDPFIVFSSNIFAVLGLRSLYFSLSGLMKMFHYLKYGLSLVLAFVGLKMMISHYYKIPIVAALSVVGGILAISILLSFIFPKPEPKT